MFVKKLLCVLLCAVTLISVIPVTAFADGEFPLIDVSDDHWAYDAVRFMYESGYMKGTSDIAFGGKVTMTRSMFVTVMAAVAGAELGSSDVSVFPDVKPDKYYTAAANWAYENQLVAGNENGEFMPNAELTREQTYVLLRALGEYLNFDVTYEDTTILSLYHDRDKIASYAKSAMAWATCYGLASGGSDYAMMPKKTATRYEIASIFYRFLKYEDIPPIEPPTVHKVTFCNWDGTVLYSANVKDGESAVYRGTTPVRAKGLDYTYTFTGWDKQLNNVHSDTTYVAVFKAVPIPRYTVTFKNWDGTVLYTSTVRVGESAVYGGLTPTKPSDDTYNYTFSGWDKWTGYITADTVFTAVFTPSLINVVRNIHDDIFGYGITVNGTDFRMSQSLSNRLNNAIASGGRTVGFYVVDLTNKVTLGYNANRKFQTASTVKAGMALCAYQRAEAGWFSLNDVWTYQARHYCDKSGIFSLLPLEHDTKPVTLSMI